MGHIEQRRTKQGYTGECTRIRQYLVFPRVLALSLEVHTKFPSPNLVMEPLSAVCI